MTTSMAASLIKAELSGQDVTFSGCSTDSRTVKKGELFIALHGNNFDGHDFIETARQKGACAAMVDVNQINTDLPMLKVADTRMAMGYLAKCWRDRFSVSLIAVTGSNGKTTVKEMLSTILALQAPVLSTQGNLNNDIGVPLTLFKLGEKHKFAVTEMGANHAGEIAWLSHLASPVVALITQCAPAHLEGFGSVEDVARAKAEIFAGLKDDGIAVINADDEYAPLWETRSQTHKKICFGIQHAADVTAHDICFKPESGATQFRLKSDIGEVTIRLPLPGEHNVMNALAAAACSLAVSIPLEIIKAGLESMQSVAGRLQIKQGTNGQRVIDDTYNANPASLEAALKVVAEFPGQHVLVLGDMYELGKYSESLHRSAGELARQYGINHLFGLGKLSKLAVESFGTGGSHYSCHDDLITALQSGLNENATVLIKGSRAMAMERVVNALVGEQ